MTEEAIAATTDTLGPHRTNDDDSCKLCLSRALLATLAHERAGWVWMVDVLIDENLRQFRDELGDARKAGKHLDDPMYAFQMLERLLEMLHGFVSAAAEATRIGFPDIDPAVVRLRSIAGDE